MTDTKASVSKTADTPDEIKALIKHSGSSRAIRTKEISFSCAPAQRLLERTFETVSARLYNLSVMLPLTTTPEVAAKIEEIASGYFDEIESDIEGQIARQAEFMTANDIDENVTFTSAKEYKCDITSRFSARYLRLIQRYEYLVTCLEAIWLEGFIDNNRRNQSIFQYQRRVGKLMGKLIFLDNSLKKVREKGSSADVADIQTNLASDGTDELPIEKQKTDPAPVKPALSTKKTEAAA